MEGIVLLRVEHLEECRRGVTIVVSLRHLVYLVKDKYGIRRTRLGQTLDDTSGHSSYIGTAMSTNLCFVVQATERHTHILTLQRFGDRAP